MEGSAETGRIERDLEHTRARLDATLGALQQKLSPGQMVDETMSWFKESGGGEFGRNLGRNVRENPIPVALIGIGVGWLMLGGGRGRGEHGTDLDEGTGYRGYDAPRYGAPDYATTETTHQPLPYEAAAYDDLATKAHEAGARVERQADESDDLYHERVYTAKGSAVGVTRQVGETLSTFRDRVETAIEAAADRVRRLSRQVGSQVSSLAGGASDRAGDATRQGRAGMRSLYGYGQSAAGSARDGADYASDKARDAADYLKDQPLLMGVLGVTVGAVLGMLVPPTRYERELAGDLRRSLGEQARGVASEITQKAARVAEDVLDTAGEAARREGLTNVSPGGVAQQAREGAADAVGRVRAVVEETAAAGRESLERELGSTSKAEGTQSADNGDRRPVA